MDKIKKFSWTEKGQALGAALEFEYSMHVH